MRLDSNILDRFGDPIGEDRIVVVDEEPWRGVIWKRLAELLHDLGRCRMRGDAEVDDLSSSVADHKPGIQ